MGKGKVINKWRKEAGLTTRALAKLSGVSRQTVLNMENDEKDNMLSAVVKVCTALGKTVNDLLHESGDL